MMDMTFDSSLAGMIIIIFDGIICSHFIEIALIMYISMNWQGRDNAAYDGQHQHVMCIAGNDIISGLSCTHSVVEMKAMYPCTTQQQQ